MSFRFKMRTSLPGVQYDDFQNNYYVFFDLIEKTNVSRTFVTKVIGS